MRRNIGIFLALLFTVSVTAQAQEGRPFRVGASFGGNLNFFSSKTDDITKEGITTSFFPSIYVDFQMKKNIYLSTGLKFNTKGAKISYDQDHIPTYPGVLSVDSRVTDRYSIRALDLPIMVKVFTNQFGNWIFNGGIGVVPSFRLGATVEHEYTKFNVQVGGSGPIEGTLTNSKEIAKQVNFFDLSGVLQVAFDYRLADRTALTMGISTDLGFLNVLKKVDASSAISSPTVKTRQIALFIGLIF